MNSKQFTILFVLLLFVLSTGYSQTQVSGSVSGTWTKANSPYIVIDNTWIDEGDTLIIEPGVEVLFDGHYWLRAKGFLQAVGVESDSIIFTHNQLVFTWAGIEISNRGNHSILEYCRIEYSDQSGINISSSSPIIRHCHILNNTDTGSNYHSGEGGGIDVSYADPLIEFNLIENNSCERGGGIHIYENPRNRPGVCRVFNNVIRQNTATWGGGIRVFTEGAATTGAACTPIIRNNVLDGNSVPDSLYGGNLYVFPGAKPQIINNIIINSPSGSGLLDLSNSIIKYNDVWNNKPYDYVDTSPGVGDISVDPLFVGGSPYDYHLQETSPCIDVGDPSAPLDPDNTVADIGAFCFGADQPPLPVTDLMAMSGDKAITLTWQNPNLIDYVYTQVVRNSTSFPQNPADGETIYTGTVSMCRNISLINGKTYFYGIFVHDKGGNVSTPSHISASPEESSVSYLRVPMDYLKIQDALNAAHPGDTVLVYPGRYSPSTNGEYFPVVMTDSVALISKSGRDSTVIDAEQTNLAILGANHALIKGFTIINGFNKYYVADTSGGFYGEPSGGAILCRYVMGMEIVDNLITDNEANGPSIWDGDGGGIYCFNSDVTIKSNTITHNRTGKEYGGIGCIANGQIGQWPNRHFPICVIDSNLIIANSGYGIALDGIQAYVQYNLIAKNGGGIDLVNTYWTHFYIENNTIINIVYMPSWVRKKAVHFKNNIIKGGYYSGGQEIAVIPVSYSCVHEGYPGEGNISASPEFVGGTPFDYHLTENSPCIDAGDPTSPLDPDGTRADIGAYYFHHTGTGKLNLSNDRISIFIDQGQDTSITLNIKNVGDWPLQIKMFGEAGSYNTISVPQPSEYGYSWIDSDHPNGPRYDWIEIESIGTKITTRETVDLPFPFCFFDSYYTSVDILYYGLLDFDFSYPYEDRNDKIPYWTRPNNIAAVFWDSFVRNNQPGSIYYYSDLQNERFIVEYLDMARNPEGTQKETFEIILNKDGTLIYQYRDVTLTTSATVGIESVYGLDGIQIAYNENYLHDNMAIKIFVGTPWINVPLLFEKIDQNQSKDFKINVPASTLDAGTYDAFIVINSNDNNQATVKIPVYLNVNPTNGDIVRPSAVSDLAIQNILEDGVKIIWTATGDDSLTGVASQYDIRYQTKAPNADTTSWWANAIKITNTITPSPAGEKDSLTISHLSPDSTYYFAMKVGDDAGNWSSISNIIYTSFPTVVNHTDIIPKKFELSQNYPNPFNPVTTIRYQLPKECHVTIKVFNALGQEIVKLVDRDKPGGYHSVNWDANGMASGLYFYRIKADNFSQVRKMLLMR